MEDNDRVWVLGHKIRLIETDESYGMIEVISSPGVPGPPPHYHKEESEFFIIIEGTLDVMTDGEWKSYSAGSFVELPPNAIHTFINNGDHDTVWVTGWRPKGFDRFFRDFGVSLSNDDGIETRDEDVNGDGDFANDDTDGDGIPNYLDPDLGETDDDEIEVFNVVTPNGDGIHDVLTIRNIENYGMYLPEN